MPQEVSLSRSIPDCTPADYHKCVYEDPGFFKQFHEVENKDPNAQVGPWVDGVREMKYTLPVNLPASAKRLVGLDAINITEKQNITWAPDRNSFTVGSTPYLDFPGSAKFTTTAEVMVKGVNGSCEVVCCLTAAAGLPWPMQSAIEAIMVQQAQVSIGVFLDTCVAHVLSRAQHKQAPAAAAAAAAAAAPSEAPAQAARVSEAPSVAPEGMDGDEFWDANDAMSVMSGMGNGEEALMLAPGRFEDALLAQLRTLNASCAQCNRSLEDIAQHLGKLSASAAAPRSSFISGQFLLGLLAASSCAAAIAFMYRQRSLGGGGGWGASQ